MTQPDPSRDDFSDDWAESVVDEHEARRRLAALRAAVPILMILGCVGLGIGWWLGNRVERTHLARFTVDITSATAGTGPDTVADDDLESLRQVFTSTEARHLLRSRLEADIAVTAEIEPGAHLIHVTTHADNAAAALESRDLLWDFFRDRAIEIEVAAIERVLAVTEGERLRLIDELELRVDDWLAALRAAAPGSILGSEEDMWAISNRIYRAEDAIFGLRTDRALADGDVRLVEAPATTDEDGLPNWMFALGGALALAGAAAAVVVLRAANDRRIHTLADLDQIAPHTPTLVLLREEGPAILGPLSTQLRSAHTSLDHAVRDWRSVAVVGVDAASDGPRVTAGLVCATPPTRSVAVIDADFHRNRLADELGVDGGSGIGRAIRLVRNTDETAHRIAPGTEVGDAVQSLFVPVNGLDHAMFLADSNPDSPSSETVESGPAELSAILAATKVNADLTVVNAGPAMELATAIDAAVASDAAAVLIELGRTEVPDLERTMTVLERQGATIAGFIVTEGAQPAGARARQAATGAEHPDLTQDRMANPDGALL